MFNVYFPRNSEIPQPEVSMNTATVTNDCKTVRLDADHFSVTFSPAAIEDPQEAQSLLSLIKEYCDRGGTNVRFNCVRA